MPQHLCPRCQSALHREDESSLVFCWNCGAPHVELSEQLLEQALLENNQLAATLATEATEQLSPNSNTDAVIWPAAIRYAALAGAVAAGLSLLSIVLPPVSLLSFFWAISAPIIILGLYNGKYRQTRITPAFAARLGLLCGLAMLLAFMSLDTLHLWMQRYVFHNAAGIDTYIATLFVQDQLMLKQWFGADAGPALQRMTVPEFQAGQMLGSIALVSLIYLGFSSVAGAFAGFLRSRAR